MLWCSYGKRLISSAPDKKFVHKSTGQKSSLVETGSLRLAAWKVSGKVCKRKEFQAMLPNLSHIQGEKAQQLITNWAGVGGLAGVIKDKLILFKHLLITLLRSCLKNLIKGYSIES